MKKLEKTDGTNNMETVKKKRNTLAHAIFILLCVTILVILLNAPQESTVKLPNTEQHARFFSMKSKKEAEKFCGECHSPNRQRPLAENHPPKYRCLFCHKTK
jgi:hypothetical protein